MSDNPMYHAMIIGNAANWNVLFNYLEYFEKLYQN